MCVYVCKQTLHKQCKAGLIAFSPELIILLPSFCRPGHPTLRSSSALFLNGLCCWPGCDAVFEEFPRFLK